MSTNNAVKPEGLLQAGPFSVTGDHYVVAADTGPGYGNTVVRCFPIRCPDGMILSAAEVATFIVKTLNELSQRDIPTKTE